MDYKKEINNFFNDEKLLNIRYLATKNIFILSVFLFFLNYLLVWAKFYDSIFSLFLKYTYFAFVFSLILYLIFFKKKFFKWNMDNIFAILLWVIWIILVLPYIKF